MEKNNISKKQEIKYSCIFRGLVCIKPCYTDEWIQLVNSLLEGKDTAIILISIIEVMEKVQSGIDLAIAEDYVYYKEYGLNDDQMIMCNLLISKFFTYSKHPNESFYR